ncbi:helix-turn-helix domain-containing protein [Micromonospora craniellae]|nr:helix-turn-helix transcriptional regulator [Micromonospora craniellae]
MRIPEAADDRVLRKDSQHLYRTAGRCDVELRFSGVPLSGRERDIVLLLAQGHTDASISEELEVSRRTISYVVRGLMERFSVKSRFQLAWRMREQAHEVVAPEGRQRRGRHR